MQANALTARLASVATNAIVRAPEGRAISRKMAVISGISTSKSDIFFQYEFNLFLKVYEVYKGL